MTRLRYAVGLSGELIGHVVVNRAWWILPLVFFLGAATLLVIAGQVAAPVTLYSLF